MTNDNRLDAFLRLMRRYGALVVLAVTLTIVASAAPGILRWRAMNSLLQDNAPLLMLIVGATVPILLGCLDLSIAAMASLAAVVAALLSPALGSASALVVVAGASVIGGVQGYLIGRLQVPSFVISLGALGIFKGFAMYLTGAAMIGITPGIGVYDFLGSRSFGVSNSFLLVLATTWSSQLSCGSPILAGTSMPSAQMRSPSISPAPAATWCARLLSPPRRAVRRLPG